jgi:hypothetical protein
VRPIQWERSSHAIVSPLVLAGAQSSQQLRRLAIFRRPAPALFLLPLPLISDGALAFASAL